MELASEYGLKPTPSNLRKRNNKNVIETQFIIWRDGEEIGTIYSKMKKHKYVVEPMSKYRERFGTKILITLRDMLYMNLIRGSYDPTRYKKKRKKTHKKPGITGL